MQDFSINAQRLGHPFLSRDQPSSESCFCQLEGEIDDCGCDFDSVDEYNNHKLFPRLQSILEKDYFRFYQVNLVRPCPFWPGEEKCGLRDCSVKPCAATEVPPGIQESPVIKREDCDDELGALDGSLTESQSQHLKQWKEHDLKQDNFCDVGDVSREDEVRFVDLLKNPERFTGYRGDSARQIWKSIYEENCFTSERGPGGDSSPISKGYTDVFAAVGEMCLEKRVFYRCVSGLHTSINIHLTAHHPPVKTVVPFGSGPSGTEFDDNQWGWNYEEFISRFSPETTYGRGPAFLRNLYFVYLVELRALAKIAPTLKRFDFYTGNRQEDAETKQAVVELLDLVSEFPNHFDESIMFASKDAARLRHEFREHFMNITRIMDCVGCEKCKLWGKLQTQGLGTALKILFTPSALSMSLTRNEVVSLFNAFGRLSSSVRHIEEVRDWLKKQNVSQHNELR
ncbi:unnamed protein product [Cyprideis torosa]|uniref:Uncharacterized protein n=1 Tax=Cyprideis torosa TaxID=163714 RepID=A0A7R8ZSL7_9CRUS|nr:unnamed protein product [Cyprideis torosa]CAG0902005.1 unnamed protein product [Cyprideis torosa]